MTSGMYSSCGPKTVAPYSRVLALGMQIQIRVVNLLEWDGNMKCATLMLLLVSIVFVACGRSNPPPAPKASDDPLLTTEVASEFPLASPVKLPVDVPVPSPEPTPPPSDFKSDLLQALKALALMNFEMEMQSNSLSPYTPLSSSAYTNSSVLTSICTFSDLQQTQYSYGDSGSSGSGSVGSGSSKLQRIFSKFQNYLTGMATGQNSRGFKGRRDNGRVGRRQQQTEALDQECQESGQITPYDVYQVNQKYPSYVQPSYNAYDMTVMANDTYDAFGMLVRYVGSDSAYNQGKSQSTR